MFFEIDAFERAYLKSKKLPYDASFVTEPLTLKTIRKARGADAIAIFIHSTISEQILDALPGLKCIATMSTGFDHIDLEACKKRGIIVCNVPSYGEHTVAEHTFGLILTLSRRLHDAISQTKKRNFSVDELRGFDLHGKTLGVVGVGRIGQHVVRIARGFGMRVLGYSNTRDERLAKQLGFAWTSFENLLKQSDIVTLHVPLTHQTHHSMNAKTIGLMKRGSYLINTARGELIDTKALIHALETKKLAGAALDVLEHEGEFLDHRHRTHSAMMNRNLRLLERHNVIVTPHCAFCTNEAIYRIIDSTISTIHLFFLGTPANTVI